MPRPDDALTAQQDASMVFNSRLSGQGRKIMVGNQWIDAAPYVGMRYPGTDITAMLGDPTLILRNPRPGARFVWRKPDDRMTRAAVRQQRLRPVMMDEIDNTSVFSNVDSRKLPTAHGPREVAEAIGLGLFEMPSEEAERNFEAWEKWYIAGLTELSEKWEQEVEMISSSAMGGSATGQFEVTESKRETL